MKFSVRRPIPPLWLLGLLTFSGPVGMHIFVPALPTAAEDLHATPVALEMTISLYILGLAVGQLLYGPASDRFGRRAGASGRPLPIYGCQRRRAFRARHPYARCGALLPGARRMLGAGSGARHDPRHVSVA
jgi:MFS family permease